MRMSKVEPNSVVFDEIGVNHSWSSLGGPIKIGSTKVVDFYPSRINLEYATDKNNNVTLYKNRVWSSYLKPTKIEAKVPDEVYVNKDELVAGIIPEVKRFNLYILDEVSKFCEVRNPDELTADNFKDSMDYLMETINDRHTYIKFMQGNPVKTDKDTIQRIYNELEMLGSVYIMYAAKRRILRKTDYVSGFSKRDNWK